MKNRPVVVIEDDKDDQEILQLAFDELEFQNRLLFFDTCNQALLYLQTTTDQPLLILSDVNLPGMNGTELKVHINNHKKLKKKATPFIFFTTAARKDAIDEAYEMVQGFFEKPASIRELKQTVKTIIDYWTLCKHPNSKLFNDQ